MARTHRFLLAPALVLALSLTGCVGQKKDDEPVSKGNSPQEALDLAKETLDKTSGIHLSLKAENLPASAPGIVLTGASGVALHPASFEGEIQASLSGLTQNGQVIAIGETVWVKIALLGNSFNKLDPARIGAPNPAQLIATDGGLSDLLVSTEDVKEGDTVRGGSNNDEVLTEYTGTLAGDDVTVLVPSAASDSFEVVYQIAANGELRSMAITGIFYADTPAMTYAVTFDDYGTTQKITPP
ncbi:LppX_LprAFG lipoprotein [Nocardioides sp. Bht2]|uniref:LppX_LprAFG lipoprotein n=1 Tax=Nocardioides sp. Bht2 TaxID=3392297 RepID=UPI0039B494A6